MKIEEVRTSFTVYLIASELKTYEGVAESLALAGYMVASFNELTAAFSELPSNPPHFVIFDATENKFNLKKAIKQITLQLPESHVFLLTPVNQREQVAPMLEQGVYDLIYLPLAAPVELLRCLDRAAERDYFMYMNEKLAENAGNASVDNGDSAAAAPPESRFVPMAADVPLGYALELFNRRTPDDCINHYMQANAAALGGCAGVFFRYHANRRVLMAALSVNLESADLNGLGVDFNSAETRFKSAQLRDSLAIPQFKDMITEVFGVTEFMAFAVEALGEVIGLAVFLADDPGGDASREMAGRLALLGKALNALETEKRLHVAAVKDPVTEALNRQVFIGRIEHEISRSRRTNLPVSLILIAVDQYGVISTEAGQSEINVVLRMIARIIEKYSRVNDIVARTGMDEFGVLLPHTGKMGAAVKAERLRRILQSADFSKVVRDHPRVTISLGVSEYPTLVRDAEELHQSADEALYQIRKLGNKTCLAQAPDGFTPDFEVLEKQEKGTG